MSAAVLTFRGTTPPRFERSSVQQQEETRALRDAMLIREAKREEDTWLSVAFLALLKVMDADQRRTLEALLAVRGHTGSRAAEQAAAVIRFAHGSPEYVGRIADLLTRMGAVE